MHVEHRVEIWVGLIQESALGEVSRLGETWSNPRATQAP